MMRNFFSKAIPTFLHFELDTIEESGIVMLSSNRSKNFASVVLCDI